MSHSPRIEWVSRSILHPMCSPRGKPSRVWDSSHQMSESWTLDQDQDFWLRRTKVHADNMIVSVYFRLHPVLHPSGETEEKVGTPRQEAAAPWNPAEFPLKGCRPNI